MDFPNINIVNITYRVLQELRANLQNNFTEAIRCTIFCVLHLSKNPNLTIFQGNMSEVRQMQAYNDSVEILY